MNWGANVDVSYGQNGHHGKENKSFKIWADPANHISDNHNEDTDQSLELEFFQKNHISSDITLTRCFLVLQGQQQVRPLVLPHFTVKLTITSKILVRYLEVIRGEIEESWKPGAIFI